MQLNILSRNDTLQESQESAEKYLGIRLRVIREEMSMFESYQIRPAEKVFLPKAWTYRIICKNGTYCFGTI